MNFSFLPTGISQEAADKILEVINVFETSSKLGKYDAWVAYQDFNYQGQSYKQITYGRSQTTEFGNLKKLLEMYIGAGGTYASAISPYIPNIGRIVGGVPQSFWSNNTFKKTLKDAANNDNIMCVTQDIFFDRYYFQPAVAFFVHHQFTHPLSLLVIYDSFVHSGGVPNHLRQRFPEVPPLMGGNEKRWIKQYVDVRYEWLANHSKKLLRNTRYRPQLFQRLIADNNWNLDRAFETQGVDFP
ncbi:chitosanase [Runella limosa]|uniref:chitosanase n=1 Tax=Runella limosa TaxID=370978 RepID=UPI00041B5F22|nr:chitosanase [Runella limosa]